MALSHSDMHILATSKYYLCIPLPAPDFSLQGDEHSCSHFIVPERSESSPEAFLGVGNTVCVVVLARMAGTATLATTPPGE